jgi:hypothetical protein
MSSELYVPVTLFLSFGKVKSLLSEAGLREDDAFGRIQAIVEAAKCSSRLIVDLSQQNLVRVRPSFQLERNTVLVRNLPSSTAPRVVEEFFGALLSVEGLECKSIRPDIGDVWYVHFAEEASACQAVGLFRGAVFSVNGEEHCLGARIKTESLLKQYRLIVTHPHY